MGSKVLKTLGTIAPIAAGFIPGIGPLAAAGIGAAGGLASGGGLKAALLGGLTGGVGNAFSSGALGNLAQSAGLGTLAGAPQAGLVGPTLSKGTGIAGLLQKGTGSLSNILGGTGGGGSAFSSSGVGDLLGAVNTYAGQNDIEKKILKGQQQALGQYTPYTQTGQTANKKLSEILGLDPSADQQSIQDSLANTPGYQFRLSEGQKALERSQAARGGLFSGAAGKAAAEYGQSLADQSYQQAIANLAQQSNQGLNAANGAAGLYTDIGSTGANASANRTNSLNQGLSSLFGSNKVTRDKDGNLIYYK